MHPRIPPRRLPWPAAGRPGLLLLTLLTLLIPGCASRPPAGAPAPVPVSIPGYLADREDLTDLDPAALQGRRILLDPGHGGFFRGAQGPSGLTEAEVNLGVALYLRGLLEWAGAEVHMTRTADVDFLSPADSTLSHDLAFRANLIDSLQPDVFLSIHHNSTASRDPDVNETQTYYPLGDDGASLDLARSIHRHLVRNLGIRPAKILPGNFHVLRHSTVPAVLGEPAMISNPVIEGRLSLAASHELEAQAYFLGLLDYFSRGRPRWVGAAASGDTLVWPAGRTAEGQTEGLDLVFEADTPPSPTAPGPDPASFQVRLDGSIRGFDLSADGRRLTWRPARPLPPGLHRLEVRGRNLAGRATPVWSVVLDVAAPAALELEVLREAEQPGRHLLTWRNPSANPIPAGFLVGDRGTRLPLPPRGQGHFLLEDAPGDESWEFRRRGQTAGRPVAINGERVLPAGRELRLLTIGEEPPFASSLAPDLGWRRRLPGGGSPPGSPVVLLDDTQDVWIEGRGVLPVVLPAAGGPGGPGIQGTVARETSLWRPRLLLPALFGRTIVLDPAGGGTDEEGRFPLGDRGADWNLATARHLRTLLEGAGARVVLTRLSEVAPDARRKVLMEKENAADLFLTIGRTPPQEEAVVAHHPGSVRGEIGARALVQALGPLDPTIRVESYAYLLRHTACPALEVRLPSPGNAREEILLGSAPRQMAQARALLLACAAVFAPDASLPASLPPEEVLAALPVAVAADDLDQALWDGNFPWLPRNAATPWQNDSGYLMSWDDPGWPVQGDLHTLEIHRGGHWQLWRVDTRGPEPEAQLILENR